MKKNILIVFISFFVAMGTAELTLRIVHPPSAQIEKWVIKNWNPPETSWMAPHPVLGWYPQINKIARMEDPNFPAVEVHTNSAGMRGTREYPLTKPAGMTRVALLGDSMAFGFGVHDHESFPALLEAVNKNLEVMNFAVPGYGTDQIYLSYKLMAKEFAPDIVLIGIFVMDFERATRAYTLAAIAKPFFSVNRAGRLKLHPPALQTPEEFTEAIIFPPIFEENTVQKILHQSLFFRKLSTVILNLGNRWGFMDGAEYLKEWKIGKVILKELIREIRQDGAQPVFLILPSADETLSDQQLPLEKAYRRFAKKEGVVMIDLFPAFKQPSSRQGAMENFIKWEWHWNPKGHRIAAQLIQQYLDQKVGPPHHDHTP